MIKPPPPFDAERVAAAIANYQADHLAGEPDAFLILESKRGKTAIYPGLMFKGEAPAFAAAARMSNGEFRKCEAVPVQIMQAASPIEPSKSDKQIADAAMAETFGSVGLDTAEHAACARAASAARTAALKAAAFECRKRGAATSADAIEALIGAES